MNTTPKAIFVIGPTASGKTSLGVDIARYLKSELISIDSRQVYRGLDLGTGKDLLEYGSGDTAVPYHLIDIVNPQDQEYSLHNFICDAVDAMHSIWQRGKVPVLVGGTSLYINALLNNYELIGCEPDFELRNKLEQLSTDKLLEKLRAFPDILVRTDISTRKRIIRGIEIALSNSMGKSIQVPVFKSLIVAPYFHREQIRARVAIRLTERLNDGMIEEVARLHANGVSWEKLDWFGLEYRYVALFLQQKLTLSQMHDQLLIKIHQFVKKQDIWLRKMEREGSDIYWLPGGDRSLAFLLIDKFMEDKALPTPVIRISDITYGKKSNKTV
ncbi:MAG: tRNA (adenosine(37)-N6)-dimethylallyltransferase MiaA [Lentisphaeria bacterium]